MGSQKGLVLEPRGLDGDWSGLEEKTQEVWDLSLPSLQGRHGAEGPSLLAWSPWSDQARWARQEDRFLAEREAPPGAFLQREAG